MGTTDTPDTDTLVLDIMAKGPLTPSPRLMLMPTTLMDILDMVDTTLDTPDFTTDMLDTDMVDSTADSAMAVMDTWDKYFQFVTYSLLHFILKHRKIGYKMRQDLSVTQQLESSIKNGLYQFEFLPSPVLLPFQCYQISL